MDFKERLQQVLEPEATQGYTKTIKDLRDSWNSWVWRDSKKGSLSGTWKRTFFLAEFHSCFLPPGWCVCRRGIALGCAERVQTCREFTYLKVLAMFGSCERQNQSWIMLLSQTQSLNMSKVESFDLWRTLLAPVCRVLVPTTGEWWELWQFSESLESLESQSKLFIPLCPLCPHFRHQDFDPWLEAGDGVTRCTAQEMTASWFMYILCWSLPSCLGQVCSVGVNDVSSVSVVDQCWVLVKTYSVVASL